MPYGPLITRQFGPNPKGAKLAIQEMDGNLLYLSESIDTVSGSFETFTQTYNTGSFTGSFVGDGSQLTGVTAEWDGTHVGNAEITGSLTLTTDLIARDLEPSGDIFLNKNKTLYLNGQSVADQGIYANLFGNGEVIIYSGSTQLEIGYNGSPQVTITNANLFLAGNVTASSYTGSFVGDGSQLTGIVSSKWSGSNPISRDSNVEITGSLFITGDISSLTLTGSDNRIVLADPQGTLEASNQTLIEAYINPTSSAALLLDDTPNWDIYGAYTGAAITGTVQGQRHYNIDYFFEAVDDNDWIRLIRG